MKQSGKILQIIFFAALLPIITVTVAQAATCFEKSQTSYDLTMCGAADAKKAEDQLHNVYDKLIAKISEEGKEKLRAAQEEWESYRDKQCEFDTAGSEGGTVHPMIVSECYAGLAVQQKKLLEHQLNCQQGDLSCGSQ